MTETTETRAGFLIRSHDDPGLLLPMTEAFAALGVSRVDMGVLKRLTKLPEHQLYHSIGPMPSDRKLLISLESFFAWCDRIFPRLDPHQRVVVTKLARPAIIHWPTI